MSFQTDKSVPLLAGEAFCEKPPLTYWAAGAAIAVAGSGAWSARLPNLLYALISALSVGLLARRAAGPAAGAAAAAAIGTFLLSYQVVIWLATDAPLLAAVSAALLGAYRGFYAAGRAERLRGYSLMHGALALGFLSKSAVAWMVPALTLATLVVWERRWKELLRWELYAGLLIQAFVILVWVGFVYAGPDGVEHLKVFFWNNLAGRFVHVDAPQEFQYAAAHRNTPGKYFLELPVYLWPWTLLVAAAARRAWIQRRAPRDETRAVRFALASALPPLVLLSVAATARNIYLAPALPGFALLLGWWYRALLEAHDRWDRRAVRTTALLLLIAVATFSGALAITAPGSRQAAAVMGFLGLVASAVLAVRADSAARRGQIQHGAAALLMSYCMLLAVPALVLYARVDAWQDLGTIGRAIGIEAAGKPLVLMTPDETTRAMIDLYTRTQVDLVPAPMDASSIGRLKEAVARKPQALIVVQLAGRDVTDDFRRIADTVGVTVPPLEQAPGWAAAAGFQVARRYSLPNGRRYALLTRIP